METIGKYQVLAEVARGGAGVLYRAHDPSLRREVAIKVLYLPDDERHRDLFSKEAAAVSRLRHKNIVSIYDSGIDKRGPFLVMEFLEGDDLTAFLRPENRMPLWRTMDVMQQVAEGLDFAHQNGVIHRDVTPSNVRLLTDGTVKLIDFGIASAAAYGEASAARPQGTLLYLSPEHFSGPVVDARSDIFAYGSMYYELLSGQHPFLGEDSSTTILNISLHEPVSLQELVPNCPKRLVGIVHRALAKEPALRYQSFRDLVLSAEPILASLKRREAEVLVEEARRLSASGEVGAAQIALRRALAFDRSNHSAITLREQLQQEVDRTTLQEAVEVMIETAAQKLADRKFREAIDILERARRINAENGVVKSRLAEALEASMLHQRVTSLLSEANQEVAEVRFGAALNLAAEAFHLDPKDPNACALVQRVERMVQQEIDQKLRVAEDRVNATDFSGALELLQDLDRKYPKRQTIASCIESANISQQAHEARMKSLRANLASAKELLAKEDFPEAVALLKEMQQEFSKVEEISLLLSYAQEELGSRRRVRAVERAALQAQQHYAVGDFKEAIEVLLAALQEQKDETRLVCMLEAAKKAEEEYQEFLRQKDADQLVRALERCYIDGRTAEFERLRASITPEQINRHARIREIICLFEKDSTGG